MPSKSQMALALKTKVNTCGCPIPNLFVLGEMMDVRRGINLIEEATLKQHIHQLPLLGGEEKKDKRHSTCQKSP